MNLLMQDVAMPVALAPVGLTGMQHADGEIKAARAAEKFGVPYTLSTMSICSIEDVAKHSSKPFWFQVYTLKDDDFMRRLMERGYQSLLAFPDMTEALADTLFERGFYSAEEIANATTHGVGAAPGAQADQRADADDPVDRFGKFLPSLQAKLDGI